MDESKHKYEVFIDQKAHDLGKVAEHPVCHGSEGVCPNCGHFGYYDLHGLGLSPSSIFYSTVLGEWRCRMCEFESLAI